MFVGVADGRAVRPRTAALRTVACKNKSTVHLRPYSLPRDPYDCALRAPLRMTKQSTVSLCFIMLFYKYGHRRHARRGSLPSPTCPQGLPDERIFSSDEKTPTPPLSRDKFRCSARQTRQKPPDSTTGTADGLRPKFNTAEREKICARFGETIFDEMRENRSSESRDSTTGTARLYERTSFQSSSQNVRAI